MNNPRWSITTMLFMQYIFFRPLNQLWWDGLFQGLRVLMNVSSINPMQLKIQKLCHQNLSLLNNGPMNLVGNGIIDARCNKYAIIIYYTLIPIPHEGIIFSHTIIFHEQDETKQTLFQCQLGWSHNSEVWLPCWPHMINNNWDCKLH
jgi:hypothetical protein